MIDKKSKKADITTVAKVAKVSPSTVSRYFNHPDLLKIATQKRIDSAVRKTGYIRNRAAQTIHGIRSGTIGVIVPTLDHAIFAEVVQAFSETVEAHGFTILLASHGYDLQREYAILRKLLEHRVDGIVLTGLKHEEAVFQLLDRQDIPCALMWNYSETSRIPSIGADNEHAGRLVAQHVMSLGHKSIACMFPPTGDNDRARGRKTGVLNALQEADINVPTEWMLETQYSISDAKNDARELFLKQTRPTALICGNDVLAAGALYAVTATGLSVPDDITVVGIGDFQGSSEIEPSLTTVRLPARKIGEETANALAAAIVSFNTEPINSMNCVPKLIKRGSSAAPRSG